MTYECYHSSVSDSDLFEVALYLVTAELAVAREKFPKPMNSRHEGYAVIKEELDELWDAIKRDNPMDMVQLEAVQVAAMALRFLIEVAIPETSQRTGYVQTLVARAREPGGILDRPETKPAP